MLLKLFLINLTIYQDIVYEIWNKTYWNTDSSNYNYSKKEIYDNTFEQVLNSETIYIMKSY